MVVLLLMCGGHRGGAVGMARGVAGGVGSVRGKSAVTLWGFDPGCLVS